MSTKLQEGKLRFLLARRCQHRLRLMEEIMANTRLPSDGKDLEDARRLRQMLSPDLAEVLHMLDAFETDLQPRSISMPAR